MSTRRVHYFADAFPADAGDMRSVLGGKGAGLKEMTLQGFRVPPGFTLTAAVCEEYFRLGRRWPDGLAEEIDTNLQRLEKDMGRRFGRGPEPLLVSVRSGAAVSMPGMMDTLLNCGITPALAAESPQPDLVWSAYRAFILSFAATVHGMKPEAFPPPGGLTPEKAALACLATYARATGRAFPSDPRALLTECINAVFESWNSERAATYRKHHDIRGLLGTAVNVQAMFPSEVSGVVFTRDPNHLESPAMVIESSYGLGEAVVSGDVAPDRFLVNREGPEIRAELGHKVAVVSAVGSLKARPADEPSLGNEDILHLRDLSLRIEHYAGFPVDIEFGYAAGRFAVLQYRRIRGLELAQEAETGRQEEIERLRALAGRSPRCWVMHNLAETLRFPTPLTWDIMRHFMSGAGGFGLMYRKLGYQPSNAVCRDGFLELICGRIYADPLRQAELFWDGIPLGYDMAAMVANPALLNQPPSHFEPERADGRFLLRLPAFLAGLLRSSKVLRRARATADRTFRERILPGYLATVQQKRTADLTALDEAALLTELDARRALFDTFGAESLLPGFAGGVALAALTETLTLIKGPQEGPSLAAQLTQAGEEDTTFQQDCLLHKVADGSASMAEFVDRYGHRAAGEMELAAPRWREDRTYLDQLVERFRRAAGPGPDAVRKANLEKRRQIEETLLAELPGLGASSMRESILCDLADARRLLAYRETGKHYLMMAYELIRNVIEELARRHDLGRDIYFLQRGELGGAGAAGEAAARRRTRWQALQRLSPAEVVESGSLDHLGQPEVIAGASEFIGQPVSAGVSTGIIQVVFSPQDLPAAADGYILVCPSTDPGWTPLFIQARGLVVERGGVLSHGAIVARDFGIPALVLKGATGILKSGARARIDGNTGRITLLEDPHHA